MARVDKTARQMEIGVVGHPDFTLGFRLAGVKRIFDVEEPKNMEKRLREVISTGDVGILVLHGDDFARFPAPMRKELSNIVRPVVIPVGPREDSDLREKIKQAVGVDLWK
ncbi:MAG TPA: V-type ATP synthase subunit F [Candidatus Thermoplasmatota archaeon]|nr:V-type ATP synthase subunit F [Candidatus Thermoplasmatota archaeon]